MFSCRRSSIRKSDKLLSEQEHGVSAQARKDDSAIV